MRGTRALPECGRGHAGDVLVHGLTVAWPNLTVTATDFVANPARAAAWNTPDGGATWDTG